MNLSNDYLLYVAIIHVIPPVPYGTKKKLRIFGFFMSEKTQIRFYAICYLSVPGTFDMQKEHGKLNKAVNCFEFNRTK